MCTIFINCCIFIANIHVQRFASICETCMMRLQSETLHLLFNVCQALKSDIFCGHKLDTLVSFLPSCTMVDY